MNFKGALKDIRKMKKQLEGKPEELITLYFPTLNKYFEYTFKDFNDAQMSSLEGKPNKLAKELMKLLNDGHVDEDGFIHFFSNTENLWNDEVR